jgi:hypothetical protein
MVAGTAGVAGLGLAGGGEVKAKVTRMQIAYTQLGNFAGVKVSMRWKLGVEKSTTYSTRRN